MYRQLQQDNAPTQEVYYERYKKRIEKENADTADEVEAQPADGWSKFNLYVYNNQRESEDETTASKQKKHVKYNWLLM